MKNYSVVSKISLWLINITLLGVLLVVILMSVNAYRIFSDSEMPKEGLYHWNSEINLNIGDIKLMKTLVADEKATNGIKGVFSLELPSPKINDLKIDKSKFEVNARDNQKVQVEPVFDAVPIRYIIKDEVLKSKIAIGFTISLYLFFAVAFYWLWILRQFVKSTVRQEFFTRKNSLRMVILSLPFLLHPIYENVFRNLTENWFMKNFSLITGNTSTHISIDPTSIIFGLVFLIMAGVIYEGMKVKEENDLTV